MSHAAICVPNCPTGYTKLVTERQCVLSTSIAVCESFDTKNFVNAIFVPAQDVQTVPVYRRGRWFNSNTYITLDRLMLDVTWTVELWAKQRSGGVGLSVNRSGGQTQINEENLLTILLESTFSAYVYEDSTTYHKASAAMSSPGTWHSYAVTLEYTADPRQSQLTLYLDNSIQQDLTIPGFMLVDSKDNAHLIGAELDYLGSIQRPLSGFIYKVCIHSEALTSYDIASPSGCPPVIESDPSPIDRCLIECNYNEYSLDGSCTACDSLCEGSCQWGTNCNSCNDELCETCDDYETCSDCITNASGEDTGCLCDERFFYQASSNECVACHETCLTCESADQNGCLACQDGWFLIGDI